MRLVDLFCGCGGFSLGAHQAGFDVVSAYDNNATLTRSFSDNFPNTHLFNADISDLTGADILNSAGGQIDGIVGGPPCQGFSDIGRRDKRDPRRQLLAEFFRVVGEVRPVFFVMENVRGLAYSDARFVLDEAISMVIDRYDIFGPMTLNAADFGAATNRRRVFVIGVERSAAIRLDSSDFAGRQVRASTVAQAIKDLTTAVPMGDCEQGFDHWRITSKGRPSLFSKQLRNRDLTFTGHRQTKHSLKVSERFATISEGGVDHVGRHPRLAWNGQCPTLRAGTGSDRGSYQSVRPIHPSEPRVITVREAARLQGFPDSFRFHPTVWHSFRMIGNSVSPFVAKVVLEVITSKVSSKLRHFDRTVNQAAE